MTAQSWYRAGHCTVCVPFEDVAPAVAVAVPAVAGTVGAKAAVALVWETAGWMMLRRRIVSRSNGWNDVRNMVLGEVFVVLQ